VNNLAKSKEAEFRIVAVGRLQRCADRFRLAHLLGETVDALDLELACALAQLRSSTPYREQRR
jgi:hypothetical protein